MAPNRSRRDVLGAMTAAGVLGALSGCNWFDGGGPDDGRGPGRRPGDGRGPGPGDGRGPGPGDGRGPGPGDGRGPGPGDGRGPGRGTTRPADGTATAGSPSGGTVVVAGPGGRFVFDPEAAVVAVGETVTWRFASPGHNVSCYPDHSEEVTLPEGAEPSGSTPPDEPLATVPEGETYSHAFETAGTYQYVCVPHVAQGMVGRVVVEG